MHGVDVRVAQQNRALNRRLVIQQLLRAPEQQHMLLRELVLLPQTRNEPSQRGVDPFEQTTRSRIRGGANSSTSQVSTRTRTGARSTVSPRRASRYSRSP